MTPAKLDLELRTGTTFGPVLIRCKDGEGDAVNLAGWSCWAEVRKKPDEAVQFDLAPQITDAAAGEITITLTDEQTAALTKGRFQWDLLLENPAGQRLGPYVAGVVVVLNPITQPA